MLRFRGVYVWSNRADAKSALVAILVLAAWSVARMVAADSSLIKSVAVNKPFFNPTIGQSIGIDVEVASPGSISILVLDRDGYPVRRLVSARPIQAGKVGYEWNGRDEAGAVVPDEAYSLKIDFSGEKGAASYFPAKEPPAAVSVDVKGYNRRSGILSYKLSAPSRVHAQAGVAKTDEKTKKPEGPVLKTLANREPRPAGAVIENWDGFDETRAIYVPDLPNFAVAVAASGLPENSLIAIGNESLTFPASVSKRRGDSLLPSAKDVGHEHHKGLTTLDDVAPNLRTELSGGTFSEAAKTWTVMGSQVSGSVSLEGPSASHFARQPGKLEIYVDSREVKTIPSPTDGMRFDVTVDGLGVGPHILAFNWSSDYGPVAVTSLRIEQASAGGGASPASAKR